MLICTAWYMCICVLYIHILYYVMSLRHVLIPTILSGCISMGPYIMIYTHTWESHLRIHWYDSLNVIQFESSRVCQNVRCPPPSFASTEGLGNELICRLLPKQGCKDIYFWLIFLKMLISTINEAHKQYSLLDTIFNYIL